MPELAGFRVASWDTPLRANPNRQPGRWNYADSGATQYIGLHPLTPWAEYLRWHDLRDPLAVRELRLAVWGLRVIVPEVHEVTFDNAATLVLRPEDLVSDDWSACQAAAEQLRRDRAAPKVLRTPSAALSGTRNIVILEPRVAAPYIVEPVDLIDIPTSLAGARARPPIVFLELIRFQGALHAEFDAWQLGESYDFLEPSSELLAEDARS